MERAEKDAMERIGPLEIRVEVAEQTLEAEQRWQQRAEILANWLLSEWECERKREAA